MHDPSTRKHLQSNDTTVTLYIDRMLSKSS